MTSPRLIKTWPKSMPLFLLTLSLFVSQMLAIDVYYSLSPHRSHYRSFDVFLGTFMCTSSLWHQNVIKYFAICWLLSCYSTQSSYQSCSIWRICFSFRFLFSCRWSSMMMPTTDDDDSDEVMNGRTEWLASRHSKWTENMKKNRIDNDFMRIVDVRHQFLIW